jgi:polysaccharide biosynthesis/export protein
MFSTYKRKKSAGFKILLYSLLMMIISSCVPQKKLIYLQEKGNKKPEKQIEYIRDEAEEITIQPGDELYIRVSSSDEQPTNFEIEAVIATGDITVYSYAVDGQGFVKLPYIGELNLLNFTLQKASDTIETLLTQFLLFPSVSLKFVNKKVTILGEVGTPGVYTFYDKNINMLQAIGYANDITTFGDRKNVLLIREENGIIKKNYLDLTTNDILTSDMYIVKSNDIIYVQPLRKKHWGMETFPYDLLFTMITTALLILTFMRYPVY